MASPSVTQSIDDVRVITTIGHVDHGKTTFVDYLLASNNIISSRMAGKIRYMDSREDEQQRGITMESSAVALQFKLSQKEKGPSGGSVAKNIVLNLIDTPGHVDFSGEVSSASRLCDGALLLVDVVEGVCTQTIAVLRQAYVDRVRPILVLNKVDRLITELKMSPIEAYQHLSQVIEQVNAIMGANFASERMEDDLRWREAREKRLAERQDNYVEDAYTNEVTEYEEKDDEELYFDPDRGNVIFASAVDGWGFRLGKFAQLYATKLGIKEANLRRVLWGDFYIDPKTKRVINYKQLRGRSLKPLFVQFVLDNIWAVYDSVIMNPNPDKVEKIVNTLNLKILPRDLRSKDTRNLLQLIFGQWLSLSTCTVQAVLDVIPAPSVAQSTRVPKMLYPDLSTAHKEPTSELEEDVYSGNDSDTAAVVAYVGKMFAVKKGDLPEGKRKQLTAEEMRSRGRQLPTQNPVNEIQTSSDASKNEESTPINSDASSENSEEAVLLGFARLFSGVLHAGSFVFCVLPKYNSKLPPSHPRNQEHIIRTRVDALYLMMGRDLNPVDSVRAGNVFAIRGLQEKVWRHATLCSDKAGSHLDGEMDGYQGCLVNLGGVNKHVSPIVRVALEPVEPENIPRLVEGLKLLAHADPCVETFRQQSGEHVILTAGELHLERCLKDLRERFARIEIQASEPIVPFRETAIKAPDMAPSKTPAAPRGTIHGSSTNGIVTFTIRACPLPGSILEFLQNNASILRRLIYERNSHDSFGQNFSDQHDTDLEVEDEIDRHTHDDVSRRPTTTPERFWDALDKVCDDLGESWRGLSEKAWAFGPNGVGGCVLIDARQSVQTNCLKERLSRGQSTRTYLKGKDRLLQDFENSIETGFQIATLRGPLCAEPVEGLAYFVETIECDAERVANEQAQNRVPQLTGSLISASQDACRAGLLDWSPRLKLAMYTCDIQASTDVLGKVYGVVARRHGRIVSEEMKEGTTFFTVKAMLPAVESFGFADEIRKRTSGAASPQLIFSGYEMLDLDPFWVPTTEEELEDLGEKADRENVAKVYMDRVRVRKGMFVDRKIVEFAEKQRTLKR